MMKMRSYLKKKKECMGIEPLTEKLETIEKKRSWIGKVIFCSVLAVISVPALLLVLAHRELENVTLSEVETVQLSSAPIAATSVAKGVITIPQGTVKANPFLPYRNVDDSGIKGPDVPAFNLVEPPEMVNENSDAARVMDTIVSGILYDKFSPSAILNIEGNDYLVKKGDVVNNYKILNILQDSVTVKLGENVYTAGIGGILTEGTLNHNDVSNLNNKFGGVR